MHVIRNGPQGKDAPPGYGPCKAPCKRFIRWSRLGVFNQIFAEFVEHNGSASRLMIDAAPPQRTQNSGKPAEKSGLSRCIGCAKGGLNAKLHAVCHASGQPTAFHLTGGQVSDYKGAAILLNHYLRPRNFWRIAGMTLTGFAVLCETRGSHPAFQAGSTGRSPCPMILSFSICVTNGPERRPAFSNPSRGHFLETVKHQGRISQGRVKHRS